MPMLEPISVRNQFPDYPTGALPDLSGFIDTSWHNDTCPSFRKGQFLVWVDWPDPREREDFGGSRFIVCELDDEGCLTHDDEVLETDDWGYVLGFLADRDNEGDPLGDHHGRNL